MGGVDGQCGLAVSPPPTHLKCPEHPQAPQHYIPSNITQRLSRLPN